MRETITVEPYGSMADVAFWPLVLLLVFLAWRLRADKNVALWCALAALAILTLGSIYIIVFGMTSLSVLHDFDVALAVLGALLVVISTGLVQEITRGKWKQDRVLGLFAIGMGFVGLAMLVQGVMVPLQDLLLPRDTVEGDVTLLETHGRRPVTSVVHIGDTQVQASTSIYRTLRLGERVRADVSRGSTFIRRLERVPSSSAK